MAATGLEFTATLLDTVSFIFVAPELVGHKRLAQLGQTMRGHGKGKNADDPFVQKAALLFAVIYFVPCVWLYLKTGSTVQPFVFAIPLFILMAVMLSLAWITTLERKDSLSKLYFGVGALTFLVARGVALTS